jgi:hypothetical protein
MTISGGKKTRTPVSWLSLESGNSFLEVTLAPLRYDLPGDVESVADILVGETIGSKEDHFGSNDITIR